MLIIKEKDINILLDTILLGMEEDGPSSPCINGMMQLLNIKHKNKLFEKLGKKFKNNPRALNYWF